MPRLRRGIWLLLAATLGVAVWFGLPTPPEPAPAAVANAAPAAAASFVGEAVCAGCHQGEAEAWRGSHHQQAMQAATDASVLGDFRDATFQYSGIESRFFRRDGKFMVRTDGPDGALHDYEVSHTFGIAPLQQYLVAFPGGRYQALEIAWDSRPREVGGQRWFHLYPDEQITHGDPLHWTGAAQNWNFMCADCHSTNVRKSYDENSQTYQTTYSEVSVSCEACHGPGSTHVAWARQPSDGRARSRGAGLVVAFDERRGVTWSMDPASGQPRRSAVRKTDSEVETCGRCHARRATLHEDSVHGQLLSDDYYVALLDDGLYYPDGQVRGEVYEYGSFIQSKMHAAGVTCSDCHEPHSAALRVSGDGLCLQCHAAEPYATAGHHFHAQASNAPACVDCHMRATTFMGVDARRDHSLRIPRPDLSVSLGVPNPCTDCHADRPAAWAARTVESWYGHTPAGHQKFAHALADRASGAPEATRLLAELISARDQPAIARASALALLEQRLTPALLASVHTALSDPNALVRRGAARALVGGIDPSVKAALLQRLLRDPVRAVRIEAAAALADVAPEQLPAEDRSALQAAFAEYRAEQRLNADRPEAQLSLALLDAGQQRIESAERALQRALALDPAFVPAAVNLADLQRRAGREQEAEAVLNLRHALERTSKDPSLLHALGLSLVRQKRMGEAEATLGAAARLAPENARYGYVYAIALDSIGDRAEAIRMLTKTLEHHPYDRDSLSAMVAFERQAGGSGAASAYEARLSALEQAEGQPASQPASAK